MAEVDRALDRVRAASKKFMAAEAAAARAKQERNAALQAAQAARASWDEMLEASGISRPTLATALRAKA